MMYSLDQISVTADDLQKLNVPPTEVYLAFVYGTFHHSPSHVWTASWVCVWNTVD